MPKSKHLFDVPADEELVRDLTDNSKRKLVFHLIDESTARLRCTKNVAMRPGFEGTGAWNLPINEAYRRVKFRIFRDPRQGHAVSLDLERIFHSQMRRFNGIPKLYGGSRRSQEQQ